MNNSKNLKLNVARTVADRTYKLDLMKHSFVMDIDNEAVLYINFDYDLLLPTEIEEWVGKAIVKLYNDYIKEKNILDLPEEERELALEDYRYDRLYAGCDHIYEDIEDIIKEDMQELCKQDLNDFFEDMKDDETDWERFLDTMETNGDGYIYHLLVTIWEHPYNLEKTLRVHDFYNGNPERNETKYGEVKVYFDMEEA